MDFTDQIEENRRLLIEDILRRIAEALQPFAHALDGFLAVLFRARLPADWRQRWHEFVADQASAGYVVEPGSVRELEEWIEAWAGFCELLPVPSQLAQAESTAADRPFIIHVTPDVSGPGPPNDDSAAPAAVFADDIEVAGPGPNVTSSYKAKVQRALDILEPNVARWWQSNSVRGEVRSRATWFWQVSYYSWVEKSGQPIVMVDADFTAGEAAQAIIAEATSGWFADSMGAYYRKHRFARSPGYETFRQWQQGAVADAGRLASILAELYLSGAATVTAAGDLVVTIGDVADNGLQWNQLLSVLPLIGHLPVVAIFLKIGPRKIKIPKELAEKLKRLDPKARKALLAKAAAVKSDDEAAAIIKQGIIGKPEPDAPPSARAAAGTVPGRWVAKNEAMPARARA
jgi:hypothetical protein